MAACTVECPICHFSFWKGARKWPLCTLSAHFCRVRTEASSTADYHPTVKVALYHKSVDLEKDCKGLGCDLGQGLTKNFQASVLELNSAGHWSSRSKFGHSLLLRFASSAFIIGTTMVQRVVIRSYGSTAIRPMLVSLQHPLTA